MPHFWLWRLRSCTWRERFMGLWQLHVFKQWAISSIKSMESLGYETLWPNRKNRKNRKKVFSHESESDDDEGSVSDDEEVVGSDRDNEEFDGRGGDAKNGAGGGDSDDRGIMHVCSAWFRALSKCAYSLLVFAEESDRVEKWQTKFLSTAL